MKFLKYSLILASLLALSSLSAQETVRPNAEVNFSDEYKEAANTNLTKLISNSGNGFLAVRERRAGFMGSGKMQLGLEFYDADGKRIRNKEIDLSYSGKERDLKDVVTLAGGRMYVLTTFYNRKQEITYLFAQELNPSNYNLSRDLIKLSEVDGENNEKDDLFSLHSSKDSSHFLVASRLPYSSKKGETLKLNVFDAQMTEVWNKTTELPYPDKQYSAEEWQIDNQGKAYLMGIIYREGAKRLKRDGKPTYEYNILAFSPELEKPKEAIIDLKEQFLTDLTFRTADNGDLVCSGFYSEKGTFSIKGAYFLRLNPFTAEVKQQNLSKFDFDFVTEYLTNRSKEKAKTSGNAELFDYSLDKLNLRSDGGVILIAEQYFVERRDNRNNMMYPYGGGYGWNSPWGYNNRYNNVVDYIYHYNDIIVINIKPTGEIEWTARIPKRQISQNDGGFYSSYSMSTVQDKMYFVYNEDARNFNPNKKRMYGETADRSSVVVLAEVNREGKVRTMPLFNNSDADVITRPKVCKQIGRKEMLIYGERGRTYRFAKVKFE